MRQLANHLPERIVITYLGNGASVTAVRAIKSIDTSMGLTLTESLHNLLRRAETPGVRSFVRAMTQGEQLGVSTGQILRTLADEMRKRRKAAAEERAQKAPIKMLFPLLIFIFPAMFVIILLPAILRIADTLK